MRGQYVKDKLESYIGHVKRYGVNADCEFAVEEFEMRLEEVIKAAEQLQEYQDTGLSPERCAELAAAEADGRLAVFPCKVGDYLYKIKQLYNPDMDVFGIECLQVSGFHLEVSGLNAGKTYIRYDGSFHRVLDDLDGLYFTRPEAEAALAKMRGDTNA